MVDVSVRQHHVIYSRRVESKLLVEFVGVDTLKQAAVKQNLGTNGSCKQVFAARNGAGGTKKLNCHGLGMYHRMGSVHACYG